MKKILFIFVLLFLMMFTLASCGGNNTTTDEPSKEEDITETQIEDPGQPNNDSVEIEANKKNSLDKLDEIVKPLIAKITDAELKSALEGFYDSEKTYINNIKDLETAKASLSKVSSDFLQFANNTIKPLVISKLDVVVAGMLDKISYEEVKTALEGFYQQETAKISSANNMDEILSFFEAIPTDLENFVKAELARIVVALKNASLDYLDKYVLPLIESITDEDIKNALSSFYQQEKVYLTSIETLEEAEAADAQLKADLKDFAIKTIKPLVIQKLNAVINPLIAKITKEDLKNSIQAFYDTEMEKVDAVESIDGFVDLYTEILNDTKGFIKEQTEALLLEVLQQALDILEPYGSELISKIPYDDLKADVQAFYDEEVLKLKAVEDFDQVMPTLEVIEGELVEFALEKTKEYALSKFDEVVDEGLSKLPNENLKNKLNAFADEEIAKLEAVEKMEDVPTTLATVAQETANYVTKLLADTLKEYVARLTQVQNTTAYDYIPDAMKPSYSANLVNASDINYDFTTFVSVSDINQAGFGEQWQMVIQNIEQSVKLAQVFNAVQTIMTSAGAAVDIYIENTYSDSINYELDTDNYSLKFQFKDAKIIFNIVVKKEYNIPVAGTVKPVIIMEYDLTKDAKGMFISLGDSYKIKYVVTDNSYEMATTYGVTVAGHVGSRSAYLLITKENGATAGHIYEYTTIDGSDKIKACADFYIANGYVSVVGNKSSGMLGFDGYINELYLENQGRMIGYEIQETKTINFPVIGDLTATYNTLWFNIWNISGIESIKVVEKTNDNKSSLSKVNVYLNGNETKLFVPTYNSVKVIVKTVETSRKYDIEFRTRYYYSLNAETGELEVHKVDVPMFFIQEGDNYNSFEDDVKKNNPELKVALNSDYLNKILEDYDTLIPVFMENKENMSSEQIISYLEQYE